MRWYVYLIGFIVSIILAIIGGVAFRFLEVENERQAAKTASVQLQELFASKPCLDMSEVAWLDQLFAEARIGGIRFTQNTNVSSTIENITNWDIQSTLFLALQVMGSVGYGNAPPVTTGGRVFCVFYGLVGLPLFIIAAYGIGDQLFDGIDKLRIRIYQDVLRRQAPPRRSNSGLVITLIMFTVIGLAVFIAVPAAIFYSLEDWAFGEALYCCFITILTIGYADFVPGENAPLFYRSWYLLAVGVWIMLSLLWFGSIFAAIRKLLKYDEIHEPFRIEEEEDDDHRNLQLKKKWKKHFDRQWRKLHRRGHPHYHHYLHDRSAGSSPQPLDARQRVSRLEVQPVYSRQNKAPAMGSHVYPASSKSATGVNVRSGASCIHVRN